MEHRVVSQEEWLAARKQLLRKEKELTRLRDQVSAERRELPGCEWTRSTSSRGLAAARRSAICCAPLAQIEAFKARLGWRFKWVSPYGSDFNFDYQVSFDPDALAKGKVYYNYAVGEFPSEEAPGISAFYRDADGSVFHTYSAYARGLDLLIGAYNYLDLAPKGRDEAALPWTMAWVRHHDRYDDKAEPSAAA